MGRSNNNLSVNNFPWSLTVHTTLCCMNLRASQELCGQNYPFSGLLQKTPICNPETLRSDKLIPLSSTFTICCARFKDMVHLSFVRERMKRNEKQ